MADLCKLAERNYAMTVKKAVQVMAYARFEEVAEGMEQRNWAVVRGQRSTSFALKERNDRF